MWLPLLCEEPAKRRSTSNVPPRRPGSVWEQITQVSGQTLMLTSRNHAVDHPRAADSHGLSDFSDLPYKPHPSFIFHDFLKPFLPPTCIPALNLVRHDTFWFLQFLSVSSFLSELVRVSDNKKNKQTKKPLLIQCLSLMLCSVLDHLEGSWLCNRAADLIKE